MNQLNFELQKEIEIERIEQEKMDFLETYSEQLYKDLSSKGNQNESVIYTITKLLLNPKPLLECEEYQMIYQILNPNLKDKTNENRRYLSSILGCIEQRLQRIGAYEKMVWMQHFFTEDDTDKKMVLQ